MTYNIKPKMAAMARTAGKGLGIVLGTAVGMVALDYTLGDRSPAAEPRTLTTRYLDADSNGLYDAVEIDYGAGTATRQLKTETVNFDWNDGFTRTSAPLEVSRERILAEQHPRPHEKIVFGE